jgi:hypothetical protein
MEEFTPELAVSPEKNVDRHSPEIVDALKEAPVYKKQGEVRAVIASGGEVIETQLKDGTVETRNTASNGDAIVTNPGGEQYIIKSETFQKRYEPKLGEEGIYTAKGYIRAIDNPFGSPVKMLASWGEMQYGARDCLLADTFNPETNELGGEPYMIGRTQFEQTYKLAE